MQFEADLNRSNHADGSPPNYEMVCKIVSAMIRSNSICLEGGRAGITGSGSIEKVKPASEWIEAASKSNCKIRLMTSGTTAMPKRVEHSVRSLTRGVRTGDRYNNDVWGLAYPLDHLAGLQVLFQALFNRNTIVQLFGLPTEDIHQAIEKYDITHLSCTPTFLKMLATGDHSHTKIKRLTTGGERSDDTTITAIKQIFPNARHRNIYALTEVGNLLIGEGDRFTVPADLTDLVCVKNDVLAVHRSLLADTRVVDSDDNESDWFLTGDLVEVQNEDPLTFKFSARQDDIINVGGYKVVPQQVEDQLLKLPSIQQAVVYGMKNSVTGQIVVCDVVLEPGEELDMVVSKQKLADQLPRYAVPRLIHVVESLRMTASGKLCRHHETS